MSFAPGCEKDLQNYSCGTFDNKTVFLHEAVWVLDNKKLIPSGKLVAHRDGNTLNNNASNLYLVDENKEYGDLHDNKTFHQDGLDKELIVKHFPDIAEIIFRIPEGNLKLK